MLGVQVSGFTQACNTTTGGVDMLLIFDAEDFNFTEAAADADGNAVGYSAIARRDGATEEGGAFLFEIEGVEDTIGIDINQSNGEGTSSAYEYNILFRLLQLSQKMTNFSKKLDAASICGAMGFIWRSNDGKIHVAGEKYVGGNRIPKFKFRQDGSKFSTGKKFTDPNSGDFTLKSNYSRLPYEFTGGIAALEALMPE